MKRLVYMLLNFAADVHSSNLGPKIGGLRIRSKISNSNRYII